MGEHNSVPRSGNRKALMTVTAMSVVAMLILIGMVLLSGFPGTPEDAAPETIAPPEDVRSAE